MGGRIIGRIIPDLEGPASGVPDTYNFESDDAITFGSAPQSTIAYDGTNTNWDVDTNNMSFRNVSNQAAIVVNPLASVDGQEVLLVSDAGTISSANLVSLYSNNSSSVGRALLRVHNDHVDSINTTPLTVVQDAEFRAIYIRQNANHFGIEIDSFGTTSACMKFTTTSQTTGNVFAIPNANSLTTGSIVNYSSSGSDPSPRSLSRLANTGAAASNCIVSTLIQKASFFGLYISNTSDGGSILIDSNALSAPTILVSASATTTGIILSVPKADKLTTGSIASLLSTSTTTSGRDLVVISNLSTLATGAVPLAVSQAAAHTGLILTHSGTIGVGASINRTANSVVSQAAVLISASNSGGAIYGIDLTGVTSNNAFIKVNSAPITTAGAVREQFKYVNSNGDVYYLVGYAAGT